MNPSKPSRTPFQNDLLDAPGNMACLCEQGVPINFNAHNEVEQHLTLDFMFSVPFMMKNSALINVSVANSKIGESLLNHDVPVYDNAIKDFAPWAIAAHFWTTYVKREVEITFMPIKCYTPVKVRVDIRTAGNKAGDDFTRRNFSIEYDDSGCHPTTVKMNTLNFTTYKISSIAQPRYIPGQTSSNVGIDTKNIPFECARDASINYYLTTLPQPGVLFPRNYSIYVFIRITNVMASTIISPSAVDSLDETELGMRNNFVLTTLNII